MLGVGLSKITKQIDYKKIVKMIDWCIPIHIYAILVIWGIRQKYGLH